MTDAAKCVEASKGMVGKCIQIISAQLCLDNGLSCKKPIIDLPSPELLF